MTSAKVGEPLVGSTVRTSSKVTVAERVSDALRLFTVASLALVMAPEALVSAKREMMGTKVSMAMLGLKAAVPLLSAAS